MTIIDPGPEWVCDYCGANSLYDADRPWAAINQCQDCADEVSSR